MIKHLRLHGNSYKKNRKSFYVNSLFNDVTFKNVNKSKAYVFDYVSSTSAVIVNIEYSRYLND